MCGFEPSVLSGSDFADFGSVFQGAWAHIVNAIATANKYGIGVLIGAFSVPCAFPLSNLLADLHAAPGKQVRRAISSSNHI